MPAAGCDASGRGAAAETQVLISGATARNGSSDVVNADLTMSADVSCGDLTLQRDGVITSQ